MKKPWPWETTEKRQSSFTDTLIRAIQSRANGTTPNPRAVSALEMASGTVSRAFMEAEVDTLQDTLTPSVMALIGRELIRSGEIIFLIEVVNGTPVLFPSSYTTIHGGYNPDSWMYEVNLAGPSNMITTKVSSERVVHVRYAVDPSRPWHGVGPLEAASMAGRLSSEVLEALADEAAGPRGSFLPFPKDGQDGTIDLLKQDVGRAKGDMMFVESMVTSALDQGNNRNPSDWTQKRFGMDVPDSAINLNDMVTREILSACGVSPVLFDPKSSAAAREAWRQFLFNTVSSLGKIVQEELSRKLFPVIIQWQELRSSDLQARARSVDSLVKSGMELKKAMEIAGLGV